jgi:tetratricopeptide (TPR) repeat protein
VNYYIYNIKHLVYILLVFTSFNGVAQFSEDQQHQIDSLNNMLVENSLHDTSKVLIYFELANYYYLGNPSIAIELCEKARIISEEVAYLNGVSESYGWLGYLYKIQGDVSKALHCNVKSLKALYKLGNKRGIATSLNNIANIYDGQGDIEKALAYYDKSYKIYEEIQDYIGTSFSLNNMGYIYQTQKDYKVALNYYNKSYSTLKFVPEEKRDNGYHRGVTQTANNIGYIHKLLGNKEQGLQAFQDGLRLSEKNRDKNGIVVGLINIGIIYFEMGTEEKSKLNQSEKDSLLSLAYSNYQRSLVISEEIESKKDICHSLNSLITIDVYKGRLSEALERAKRSLKLANEMGYPANIRGAAKYLSQIYEKQGKGVKALEMYKLHIKMRDSINNEKTQKAAIRQQTRYEFEKEQIRKENEAKEQARLAAEATSRRNNLQYSLIFLGILVLFGIVLSLGFIKVSPNIAEGIIFFAFLILFEFLLVFTEPYIENYTDGEPMYNLLANSVLALIIFPLHAVLERLLKQRIVK